MMPVTLRRATPADADALERLAERDSARRLERGAILLAEAGDGPVAAICLHSGRVIADPFSHTAAMVELLRARAGQLSRGAPPRAPRIRAVLAPLTRRLRIG